MFVIFLSYPPPDCQKRYSFRVSSLSFDSREPSRIVFLEPGNSFARDRLLDVTADGRDVIDRSTGMNDQMNVVRHEHPRPQVKLQTLAGVLDGRGQPLARPFATQKRQAMVARERQCVSVTGVIEIPPMNSAGMIFRGHGH